MTNSTADKTSATTGASTTRTPSTTLSDSAEDDHKDRPRTMAEKVWENHIVSRGENGDPDLIYIDLHLVHEVTSPQAFDGLRMAGRPVRRPDLTIATEDHNVPTIGVKTGDVAEIKDITSRTQVSTLRKNAEEFGVKLFPMGNREQGICSRGRATIGADPARDDGGVRGLAHRNPRSFRSDRIRHRNFRSRTCDGHADLAPQAIQNNGG